MRDILKLEAGEISRLLGTVGSPLIVITELIKNAVDAEASQIGVQYNKENSFIRIWDNGLGISLEEIKNLAHPGVSRKKNNGYIKNSKGFYFTGSKGLGILSGFSLCNQIQITTYSIENGCYEIFINKDGNMDYNFIEDGLENKGTIITLLDVPTAIIDFLTTASEIQKIRHISTYLYKKDEVDFPKITFQINDEEPTSIFLDMELSDMVYDVSFNYIKSSQMLYFQCLSESQKNINSAGIKVENFDLPSLEEILMQNFGIAKTIKTKTNAEATKQAFTELEHVPSFEGRILVYDNRRAKAPLKQYGAGVNIYLNNFAIYNYLSADNDWLGLADFSQTRKITSLKPHNVFGYVNLYEFNENEEKLNISNERADFIQDQTYIKLMYLIKGVIMFFIFNIDVSSRNNDYKIPTKVNKVNEIAKSDRQYGNTLMKKRKKNGNQDSQNQANKADKEKNSEDRENQHDNPGEQDKFNPKADFRPYRKSITNLTFTEEEGKKFHNIKNKNILGKKIFQLVCELAYIDMQKYPCAVAGLYRSLLECVTRYACERHADDLEFKENRLAEVIGSVINYYSNKYKNLSQQAKGWRDTINKRSLIITLNQYMHTGLETDLDFIVQTWKTMKGYIVQCIMD